MNHLQEIDRRLFLKFLGASAVTTVFIGSGLKTGAQMKHDEPNFHNMLVFGEKTIYLSHLPMFEELNSAKTEYTSPHRYQVILEASFQKDKKNLQDTYVNDRLRNKSVKIYTLNPESFVLPQLTSEDSKPPLLTSFKATVFRGHLEKGGKIITGLSDIEVKVNRVIHFRKFNPETTKPSQLKYILFGNPQELFLAHYISASPDFDQVLSVKVSNQTFTVEELNKGIEIVIPNKTDKVTERIKESQQVSAQIVGKQDSKLEIKAEKEIYFEEGELMIPPTFDDTESEKAPKGVR